MAQSHQPSYRLETQGQDTALYLQGDWLISFGLCDFSPVADELTRLQPQAIRLEAQSLAAWDTALAIFVLHLQRFCAQQHIELDLDHAPAGLLKLLQVATAVPPVAPHPEDSSAWWQAFNPSAAFRRAGTQILELLAFIGLVTTASGRLITGRAKTRWIDVFAFIEDGGPRALAIITLTSILVGMILGYLGAVQLEQFGAQVYVANLVGIGMAREMGALMTAVLMAGRTGAAYAAQLGTMQVNEEVDAITTLGISPVEFLVLPRILALVLVMPLLCLYADLLGMAGGSIVALGMDISATQYLAQLQDSIGLTDFLVGISKSLLFGLLIAIAGCQAGLQCGRSSAAVGQATTKAVVVSIVYLIVADASVNILYQFLGI